MIDQMSKDCAYLIDIVVWGMGINTCILYVEHLWHREVEGLAPRHTGEVISGRVQI